MTTLAGNLGSQGSSDAQFYNPLGITTDGTNLYVSDSGNNTIRKIVITSGIVSTIAGSAGLYGSASGIGSVARFASPYGITTDGKSLYLSDTDNYSVRAIN